MISTLHPQSINIFPFSRWDTAGQPTFFSQTEQLNLVHDTNGNLVTDDGLYRTYNSLNQLWKIHNGTHEAG